MAQSDEVKIENKTIRIPATAYYKAVEITGLLSAIAGHNYSLSEITADIISIYHADKYQILAAALQDEKKRAVMRAALQKDLNFIEGLDKTVKIRK